MREHETDARTIEGGKRRGTGPSRETDDETCREGGGGAAATATATAREEEEEEDRRSSHIDDVQEREESEDPRSRRSPAQREKKRRRKEGRWRRKLGEVVVVGEFAGVEPVLGHGGGGSGLVDGGVLHFFAAARLHHGLADDFAHVVVAGVVEVLHHVHDAGRGVFLAGLLLFFGDFAALFLEVGPVVVGVLALDLLHFDRQPVLLDDDAAFVGDDVLVESFELEAIVLAVDVADFQIKAVRLKVARDALLRRADAVDANENVHPRRVVLALLPAVRRFEPVRRRRALRCTSLRLELRRRRRVDHVHVHLLQRRRLHQLVFLVDVHVLRLRRLLARHQREFALRRLFHKSLQKLLHRRPLRAP
mmetsp:Transcript_19600/g.60614  ORF Transcript_19600/g.60614 Transcript_19600/m.60614 type:complete len:363 (+) Transcript_19600:81-1169(+)